MKLLVLGATGRTGREVVAQALEAGHTVTAYVRGRRGLPEDPRLTVVTGTLDKTILLAMALQSNDAVISCLGPRHLTLARIYTDLMSVTFPSVVEALRRAAVTRIVVLSVWGVGESRNTLTCSSRTVYRGGMDAVLADKQAGEQLIVDAGLNWTFVYAPRITDRLASQPIQVQALSRISGRRHLPTVNRRDVARVLLAAATTDCWSRTTVVVAPNEEPI